MARAHSGGLRERIYGEVTSGRAVRQVRQSELSASTAFVWHGG